MFYLEEKFLWRENCWLPSQQNREEKSITGIQMVLPFFFLSLPKGFSWMFGVTSNSFENLLLIDVVYFVIKLWIGLFLYFFLFHHLIKVKWKSKKQFLTLHRKEICEYMKKVYVIYLFLQIAIESRQISLRPQLKTATSISVT